jgi:hypothetical protein
MAQNDTNQLKTCSFDGKLNFPLAKYSRLVVFERAHLKMKVFSSLSYVLDIYLNSFAVSE